MMKGIEYLYFSLATRLAIDDLKLPPVSGPICGLNKVRPELHNHNITLLFRIRLKSHKSNLRVIADIDSHRIGMCDGQQVPYRPQ